jgi:hypothetical protein
MNKLLEKVKAEVAYQHFALPYSFLTNEQKLSLTDLIAYSFAREFATKKLQDIITNN